MRVRSRRANVWTCETKNGALSPSEPSSATCGVEAPDSRCARTAGSQQRVGSRTPDKNRAPDAEAARCGAGAGGYSKPQAEGQTL